MPVFTVGQKVRYSDEIKEGEKNANDGVLDPYFDEVRTVREVRPLQDCDYQLIILDTGTEIDSLFLEPA